MSVLAMAAIAVHDFNHRILFWNGDSEQLYGWSATEAIGRNAADFIYQTGAVENSLETIHAGLLEEGAWQGELHQTTQDGRSILVESYWTVIEDESTDQSSILIINIDITAEPD